MLTSSTAKLTAADAAIRRRSVDARGAVETRRRAAVLHGRRPSGVVDAVGSVVAPELAERTGVAARTAARELVDAVDAQSAVETRAAAQRPTVVHVHVAPTSGIAECADAPETVAFVDAPTYTRSNDHRRTKRFYDFFLISQHVFSFFNVFWHFFILKRWKMAYTYYKTTH